MSEATLTNLLEYLYGTLTPSNQLWLAEHLIANAKGEEVPVKPYTMDELNALLDAAEADIEAGRTSSHEDVMREWDEEIARMEREEHEMAKAV
jgi:hypothetical protein